MLSLLKKANFFVVTAVIALFLFGTSLSQNIVHAQNNTGSSGQEINPATGQPVGGGAQINPATGQPVNTGAGSGTGQQGAPANNQQTAESCGWSTISVNCILGNLTKSLDTILGAVFNLVGIQIFGLVLKVSAYIFEISVNLTIVDFSTLVLSSINVAWSTIRDVVNVGVIFALLYIALQTILGKGPELRKIIVSVVIFGLLTNFSLLFAKTIIDVSNVVALNFYMAARGGSSSLSSDFTNGLSSTLMDAAHITAVFKIPDSAGDHPLDTVFSYVDKSVSSASLIQSILASLFMIIASFLFIQMTFVIVARGLYLIFYMIISPIMFAGPIFFKFEGQIKKFWNLFVSQVLTAPIFFILLWVLLYVMKPVVNNMYDFISKQQATGFSGFATGAAAQVFAFALIVGSIQIILSFTKRLSGEFGGKIVGWGSKGLGYAVGRPLGQVGRFAGGNLGRWMQREGSGYQKLQEGLSKSRFAGARTIGNFLKNTSGVIKDSSYELQNVGSTKTGQRIGQLLDITAKLPGGVNVTKGLNFGKADSKGYEERIKEADKAAQEKFKAANEAVTKSGARMYDYIDTSLELNEGGVMVKKYKSDNTTEQWDELVKKANKQVAERTSEKNAKFLDTQEYTKLNAVDKAAINISNFVNRASGAQENRDRAMGSIRGNIKKKAKQADSLKLDKDKLDELRNEGLKRQIEQIAGSDSDSDFYSEIGITKEALGNGATKGMEDEQRFTLWQKVQIAREEELNELNRQYSNNNNNQNEAERTKKARELNIKIKKVKQDVLVAKNAKSEIERLSKKVEAAEQTGNDGKK